jgi:hypothetical protein
MARSVIARHGGQLIATTGDDGRGLRIELQWT